GNMGEALIRGMLKSEQTVASRIVASNRNATKLRNLKAKYSIRTTNFNETVMEISDIILLAVKPQDMKTACKDLAGQVHPDQIVISIAAGVTIKKLKKLLGAKVKIIRAMPNTPALIDNGVTALYADSSVKEIQVQLAEEIFGAVGLTYRLKKESEMDPVTALTGTGPAYIYDIIDTLSNTGKKLGLSKSQTQEMVAHTIIGAARMVLATGEDPIELWKRVASKGGTTVAAFDVLKKKKFKGALEAAVKAAAKRSKQLGK
ncbi:pyrroline-5-carboxylate reductase, partial [bacterium]|nr:pyrroline-5-carboxylate reductase [bacterium]